MKKYKKIILIISLLVIAPIFLYYAYYAVCWQIYLHDPNIVQHKIEAYRQLSSDKLIKKLGFWNIWWFDKALDILVERKDEEAVPYIINLLNSPYKYKRDSAIRALAKIGDKRAIEPLLAITEKGRKHSDYFDALHA